jgi:hypothetical protein
MPTVTKLVGVFVRFRAPLRPTNGKKIIFNEIKESSCNQNLNITEEIKIKELF